MKRSALRAAVLLLAAVVATNFFLFPHVSSEITAFVVAIES